MAPWMIDQLKKRQEQQRKEDARLRVPAPTPEIRRAPDVEPKDTSHDWNNWY